MIELGLALIRLENEIQRQKYVTKYRRSVTKYRQRVTIHGHTRTFTRLENEFELQKRAQKGARLDELSSRDGVITSQRGVKARTVPGWGGR